jgi:hypothetical protein
MNLPEVVSPKTVPFDYCMAAAINRLRNRVSAGVNRKGGGDENIARTLALFADTEVAEGVTLEALLGEMFFSSLAPLGVDLGDFIDPSPTPSMALLI